jgi:uncharacterized protein with von Willebrand factor type A (vWA) domain
VPEAALGADPVPEAALTNTLVAFGRALRTAGVPAGSGDLMTYCTAASRLDPSDLVDLYWAGRCTLVTRRDHIAIYDRVFKAFFLGAGGDEVTELLQLAANASANPMAVLTVPATEEIGEELGEEAMLGLMASDAETLRHKSFRACTPEELATVRRIMAKMRLTPPKRTTRRTRPASHGTKPDLRRTVREAMRTHGEPAELLWRRRKVRLRPLILILDVSGSMADYSRALLQFAYSAKRATARVEVFCFGTRLSRITRALDHRRPDDALRLAAATVFDWDGGTRIGASLDTFVRQWGRRGLCRGGIVVICSDGLDRGDPAVLAAAMERLARLCYRIVWMNPHKGDNASFRPNTLGMMVAAPHIDLLLSGHDLTSLEELAALLPELH